MAALRLKTEDSPSCYICSEDLREPVCLPCLHRYCFECLDTWFKSNKDKTQVICPACKTAAIIPEEGIRGFPGHSVVKHLKETVDMDRKEEGATKDVTCSTCEKKATVHCIDCKKFFCHQCHMSHNTFISDHTIVTVEELHAGQVTDEGRLCEVHGEKVRYYCETEEKQVCVDCVSLKTCPTEHDRITLKEAAKKHESSVEDLIKKCADTKAKFQDAVKKAKLVLDDLTESRKQTITELDNVEKDYILTIKQVIKKQKDEVNKLEQERVREIESKLKTLQLGIDEIDQACNQGEKVIKSGSVHLITNKFPSLSSTLSPLAISQPVEVNQELSCLKFEVVTTKTPLIGHLLKAKEWKLSGQFGTKGLNKPGGVAINHDGDIVVSSWEKGVKVYTREGVVKFTLYDEHGVSNVVVTPDKRYVISPLSKGIIEYYNSKGKLLCSTPMTNVYNKPRNIQSLGVGLDGRIVAGLVDDTISIHHADGSHISKFATHTMPFCLAFTSNSEIVSSFYDDKLQCGTELHLMDYSGCNVRVIKPPVKVKTWAPFHVCCGQGEIFVVNSSSGDPVGVYRYTSEGNYLGCVTTQVTKPRGIALSQDGMELFVAERNDNIVKIFRRQ